MRTLHRYGKGQGLGLITRKTKYLNMYIIYIPNIKEFNSSQGLDTQWRHNQRTGCLSPTFGNLYGGLLNFDSPTHPNRYKMVPSTFGWWLCHRGYQLTKTLDSSCKVKTKNLQTSPWEPRIKHKIPSTWRWSFKVHSSVMQVWNKNILYIFYFEKSQII